MQMRSVVFGSALVPLAITAQVECSTGRYSNYDLFDSISVETVQFGSNTPVSGQGTQALYMDVYQPVGDVLPNRPAVLVAFGGSFVAGSRADVASLCIAFAKLGYVAVAPDYRVGFFWPSESTTTKAVMRAAHDIRACVRYLHKSVLDNGNPYAIDPARIIVGGVSAGAIGALHMSYLDESSEIPAILYPDTAFTGGIAGNSGSPGYPDDVLACWSMSGAIGDTLWMNPGDEPVVSVHETGDDVVPCYTELVEVLGLPTGLYASGSHDLHLRAQHIGLENCYLEYPGTGHVGYLNSDPDFSFDHVVKFLAHQVCNEDGDCGTIYAAVTEMETTMPLAVAPNPTDGVVRMTLAEPGLVQVLDAMGRTIFSDRMPQGPVELDMSRFADGTYSIRSIGSEVRSARVLKSAR
ncbi:MAG: alpha/beta hydrolase [Flavobacteriales bacterium]|nr:alpha/beta hydrolase [Flavobacteriales bacterium]